jgi:hypothetical protein
MKTPVTPHRDENNNVSAIMKRNPLQIAIILDILPSFKEVKNIEAKLFIAINTKPNASKRMPVNAMS